MHYCIYHSECNYSIIYGSTKKCLSVFIDFVFIIDRRDVGFHWFIVGVCLFRIFCYIYSFSKAFQLSKLYINIQFGSK